MRRITKFTNHCDRDLRQIVFTVLWTGSENAEVLLIKICTLNFLLLSVIVAFTIIYMDKCYSCLQLIYLFIITGNLHTFSVYTPFWLLIVSTHLGITWPNGINWLTLTISTRCYCKKEIKSTSALKSDNHRPGFKYSRQFLSMQSSERESRVCASTRSWALGDKISLDFKLEFIPFVKIKRLRRLHIGRKSVGCHCCKLSSYAFWGTCTFAEMRDHARKLLWIKENSHRG